MTAATASGPPRRPPAWVLAPVAGLAPALAFPPFGLVVGLAGFGLMLWLLDRAEPAKPLRSAFWRGWLAGTAYFAVGTWWVTEAFLVDAANQGWMAPIALALLAGGLGLFWGAAGLVYRLLRPVGVLRLVVFAGVLCLFEWLRGHVLTGFPWNLPGEAWRAGSAPSQAASVLGAYGLSWVTVAAAAAPGLIEGRRPGRATLGALAAAGLVLAGLYGFGLVRLSRPAPSRPDAPLIRVVQADVRQESKYDAESFAAIVDRYVGLTARPGVRVPDVVVWSEGAVPAAVNDYLAPGTWTRAAIAGALRPGQTLLVGAYRVAGPPERPTYYNSLAAVRAGEAGDLRVVGLYDKFRLVPFGEYMPMDGVMSRIGFKKLVHVGDGFTPGPRPRPLVVPGLPPVQPLICYESLFPGFTREGAAASGARADWIVNVSNDAWFGATSGPIQHLNLASYRAIEEGLPIVRATPTGVSAVIDPFGRPLPDASLGLGKKGFIDAQLPEKLKPTFFSRAGDLLFWVLIGFSAVGAVVSRRSHQRTDQNYFAPVPPN